MRLPGLVLLIGLLFHGGCQESACTPCPPGTHPSDTSQFCSACVPCPDAGMDAGSGPGSCSAR